MLSVPVFEGKKQINNAILIVINTVSSFINHNTYVTPN